MSSTVIRDFLVSLGFTTDNEGARKMGDALDGVTKKSVVLKTALLALATGTVLAVAKTASELDKLYYSSQRIGASADNIRAYGDAVSQMGGDAQSALQSLESVAQKMRNSPGYEGMLQNLGVATRDGNGAMRDRVEVMKDLSKTFKDMPTYQANAYASSLGIDEKTMLAMRDSKFIDNMEKYQKIRSQVGLNDELAESGSQLMTEFNDTAIMTKAITEVVVMTAGKALLPILKLINKTLMSAIEWFDSLNPNIKAFLAAGLKIATVAVVFGGLIGVLSKIGTVLPLLKGLLFLIKGLNLAFLASPIGIVLALASAIALLVDDFMTWKNGGESLIDWSKWAPGIETAIEKIGKLVEWIGNLKDKVIDITVDMWEKAKNKIFNETTEQVVEEVKEKTQKVADVVAGHTQAVAGAAAQVLKTTASVATGGLVGASKKVYQNTKQGKLQALVDAMNSSGITNKKEQAMFLAQMDHESGGFGQLSENLNYSKKALLKTFGKYYKSDSLAASEARNPEKIANRVYGGRMGNDKNGDGYKYRGRGFIQLTGKSNYKDFSEYSGIDIVSNPDLAARPDIAAQIAVWYWNKRVKSKVSGGVKAVTKAINGGTNGLQDRINKTEKYLKLVNDDGFVQQNTSPTLNTKTPNTNATLLPNNYSASSSAKNVTIHQSYKAEMHINGAENPQMTASAIKRESENAMIRMAHNAKGVMG